MKRFPAYPVVDKALVEIRLLFGLQPGYEITEADRERARRFDIDEYIKEAELLHEYIKEHGPIKL